MSAASSLTQLGRVFGGDPLGARPVDRRRRPLGGRHSPGTTLGAGVELPPTQQLSERRRCKCPFFEARRVPAKPKSEAVRGRYGRQPPDTAVCTAVDYRQASIWPRSPVRAGWSDVRCDDRIVREHLEHNRAAFVPRRRREEIPRVSNTPCSIGALELHLDFDALGENREWPDRKVAPGLIVSIDGRIHGDRGRPALRSPSQVLPLPSSAANNARRTDRSLVLCSRSLLSARRSTSGRSSRTLRDEGQSADRASSSLRSGCSPLGEAISLLCHRRPAHALGRCEPFSPRFGLQWLIQRPRRQAQSVGVVGPVMVARRSLSRDPPRYVSAGSRLSDLENLSAHRTPRQNDDRRHHGPSAERHLG